MLYKTNSCNFLLHLLQIFSSRVFSCRYSILPVCTWVFLVLHVSRKDHLIGNSNFKQFLFLKDFQCLGAGSKGQANSVHNVMYLRIFYRCIVIQHSDIYIFSGHVMGDQDLGMQLIAAHLQANLRFIALQFTKLCKTVIQTISSVTASQHLQTQRTISPCFVA